jgi:hypothetical protein
MTAETSLESRIVGSFDRFRELPASPSLKSLRKRLVGELFGDTDAVAATFAPAFEVVIHSGESTVTLPGSVIAEGVRGEAATRLARRALDADQDRNHQQSIRALRQLFNLYG